MPRALTPVRASPHDRRLAASSKAVPWVPRTQRAPHTHGRAGDARARRRVDVAHSGMAGVRDVGSVRKQRRRSLSRCEAGAGRSEPARERDGRALWPADSRAGPSQATARATSAKQQEERGACSSNTPTTNIERCVANLHRPTSTQQHPRAWGGAAPDSDQGACLARPSLRTRLAAGVPSGRTPGRTTPMCIRTPSALT